MAHSREAIRKAIVTAVTGLTTTGTNVVDWRLYAVDEGDRPQLAVMVGMSPETVDDEIENEYGNTEVRALPVTIEGRTEQGSATKSIASDHTGVLDVLDDICAEVEFALNVDTTLGGLAVDVRLESTEINLAGGGELPVALVTMEWIVRYSVDRSNP